MPMAGKIVPDRVAALLERALREVDEGVLPSCQVALARDGEIVAFEAFGDATTDTRYLMWSATKTVTAAAVWILLGEGRLGLLDSVVTHIPEFATNGKDVVTVEHLLLHTAGFPWAWVGPPAWATSAGRRQAFAGWYLNWEPGSRYEYHPFSAHWVLAELVETLGAMDYRRFVHERVVEPLGLGLSLGLPPDAQGGVAELVARGRPATPAEWKAAGLPAPEAPPPGTEQAMLLFNSPDVRAVGIPAAGGLATAADVALFYQGLLHNTGGLWDAGVLADATGVIRCTFPDPGKGGIPVNRSRGVVVAGDDGLAYLRMNFGRTVSPRAFGHDGAGGQIAWGDPESGLSFSYLTNGLDQNLAREGLRGLELSSLAGLCAGG